jgi:hypothetical protein
MRCSILIPFCGFYESWLSEGLDNAEEMAAEYLAEETDRVVATATIQGFIYDNTNYGKAHNLLARAYVKHYQELLADEYDLRVTLEFDEMVSPREYNFETDRIFCKISDEDVTYLWERANKKDLEKVCEQHLKSRSGFHSFYDHRYPTWGPVATWDANQLSMLLYALHVGDDRWEGAILEGMVEANEFDSALDEAVDWDRVRNKIAEAALIEAGEIEPDAREFPTGANPTDYAQKFCALNHLKP